MPKPIDYRCLTSLGNHGLKPVQLVPRLLVSLANVGVHSRHNKAILPQKRLLQSSADRVYTVDGMAKERR